MDCTSPVLGIYPCGKCLNCRARSRQEWVFRLRQEYQSCNFGLFVTLTYDDEKLSPDGVSVRDVQLFIKRLRKHWKARAFRYYLVSEYGDHTFRPHYHGLFFFAIDRSDDIYDIISDSWQNGFCSFGEIEEGSIVYCTKYCLKGSRVPEGKNDNFRLVSKMYGGLGSEYIEKQSEYHLQRMEKPSLAVWQGQKAPLPRYYREKLLNKLSPEDKDSIRALYQMYLAEKRELLLHKEYVKWIKTSKIADNWPEEHYSEFLTWKHNQDYAKNERKAELFDKHTKKQNCI